MRVKCVKLKFPAPAKTSGVGCKPQFIVGKVYLVLGIHCDFGREPSYWLLMDNRLTPVYKGVSFFEIVDGRIPVNWGAKSLPAGGFKIIPIELLHKEFSLEAFFDRKPGAVAVFERVVAKLEADGY